MFNQKNKTMTEEEKKAQEAAAAESAQTATPTEPKEGKSEQEEATSESAAATEQQEPAAETRLPREILYERIRAARPDGKYDEDEQEWARSAMSMLDENDKKVKGYDDMTSKILKRFEQDPDMAQVWLDYLDGADLRSAIVKNMGEEAWSQPAEDSEGFEAYSKSRDERRKQMSDSAALIEELRNNDAKSVEAIDAFIKENNLGDEDAAKFRQMIADYYNKMQRNIVDKDMLQGFMRHRNYEKDIEAAREQGKIDGRNEKIEAKKKEMAGSGLPNANAGGEAGAEVKEAPSNPTAAWLGQMNHR